MDTDAPRILVADDEQLIREVLADFLSMEGFHVRTAADGREAIGELSRAPYDLVLSDLKMPNMGGLELLGAIQENTPNVVTVIMTGFGTVETAIHAMKQGAYDYILKPFKMEEVVQTIRRALEQQRLKSENLRLKEALSLYKVSEAIATSLSLDQVMDTVIDAAHDEILADQVAIYLKDGEGGFYERLNSTRESESERVAPRLREVRIEALAENFPEEEKLITHDGECEAWLTQADRPSPASLMATQMRVRGEVSGYLVAVSYADGRRFTEGQRKLLSMVGNRGSAAIENAKLYENLQATFRQTIRGLASAIDKMDRYTAGHSERVANYAAMIARKLDMDEPQVEIVRQAALMHDIGKIGCVMNLNKPGKLSESEYDEFKHHPGYGKDILEPIAFLHPIIPGVHFHHERWDGHGYPLGLEAQEIPIIARIISVADTYDAMTSDRAYRRALPHEVATGEIERCCGSQFDPDIAHPFLERIEEHREELRSNPPAASSDADET